VSESACWVEMNDGVRLDVSVCTPDGAPPPGGWPAALLVHGHGDNGSKAMTLDRGRRLAGRGYLAVCYSVRGQGGSEGLSFHLGARELFDLQDMIDWVRGRFPVARLAVAGSSQGGWHSWMAACHHRGVDAVVPENIFVDYADFAVPSGCLSRWFFTRTMRRRVMTAGLQYMARQWAVEGEWERLREWLRPSSPRLFLGRIRCPVFVLHGWHDNGMPAGEIFRAFERLSVPKRLYMGGGGHEGRDADAAQALRTSLVDRWLDHWIAGRHSGLLEEPAITWARRPGWSHASGDALPIAGERVLFLREGGALTREAPAAPTANSNVHNVLLDPDYTLSRAIHRDMEGTAEALAWEGVSFESAPLEAPLEILGSPRLTLHMLPNRHLFQVHARLYDVDPDGGARLVSRGHFGARAATPGRHLAVEIEARGIAWRLEAGHRLRLEICNYDTDWVFPYYEPWSARLYHEPGRASALRLPLAGEGAGAG
jgi:predicted acyl esterase